MNSKEQIFKMLEGRIDTASNLMVECMELMYKAGYNDGIEAVIPTATADYHVTAEDLRRLKK